MTLGKVGSHGGALSLACIRIAECHPVQQHIATNQMHTTHTDIRVDYKFTILLNNKGTRVIV